MKIDSALLAQLSAATRQLREEGPVAATAAIQKALGNPAVRAPSQGPSPFERFMKDKPAGFMKDINPPPSFADAAPHRRSEAPPLPSGARFISSSYTNQAGTRAYKLYIPAARAASPMPLVVMLHGCTQNPDDFAAGTRMNALAEEFGFLVAYPGQSRKANHNGCWNWFNQADQLRDRGEPSIIAGIVDDIAAQHPVDRRRVFAAGLSAGGAMAAILGTHYPDVFAAVGIHSGLPVGAARDLPSALQAMKNGRPGRGASPLAVPAIIFHGDRDKTVHPKNGSQLLADAVASASALLDPVAEPAKSAGGRKYTRTRYVRRDGATVAEEWILHGAGHTWSGGSKGGSHTDPTGPDASREMVRFFRSVTGLV
jgi:poly(hydroxyalkanoate) depolymerase family esterase